MNYDTWSLGLSIMCLINPVSIFFWVQHLEKRLKYLESPYQALALNLKEGLRPFRLLTEYNIMTVTWALCASLEAIPMTDCKASVRISLPVGPVILRRSPVLWEWFHLSLVFLFAQCHFGELPFVCIAGPWWGCQSWNSTPWLQVGPWLPLVNPAPPAGNLSLERRHRGGRWLKQSHLLWRLLSFCSPLCKKFFFSFIEV